MVNKVILLGYVGKDPEIRHIDNNLVRAQFSLATSERWVNKDGSKSEHTEWHNIVVWRNLAELAEKYVRKGSLLYIEGKIQSRSYDDKDGVKRYVIEIVADTMQFVGPGPGTNTKGGQTVLTENQKEPTVSSIESTDMEPAKSDLPF